MGHTNHDYPQETVMKKNLLAAICAAVTLGGGVHLSATPVQGAETAVDCFEEATAIHTIMESFCDGEANCRFSCSNDFGSVTSMNCECA